MNNFFFVARGNTLLRAANFSEEFLSKCLTIHAAEFVDTLSNIFNLSTTFEPSNYDYTRCVGKTFAFAIFWQNLR